MREALKNPELPPGAIVETYEDGGALRNDGVTLTPASQNPWYVLATVAGEQEGTSVWEIDDGLHAKNRRFWNGWMCRGMGQRERSALADKLGMSEAELRPLTAEEREAVAARFDKAFPDKSSEEMIPKPEALVDLRRVHFLRNFVLDKCKFNEICVFKDSHFAGSAKFEATIFSGAVVFETVHFAETVIFQAAQFCGLSFFEKAHFTTAVVFEAAHFRKEAYFASVQFHEGAYFSDGCFKAQTVFDGAVFKGVAPKFFHREMHQDTSFTDDSKLWPDVTAKNAKAGKRAYTRLRQVAAEIYDPDLEHFFLRQEMRCKARIEWDRGAWFHWLFFEAYRVIADSGISVARPFWLLVFAWAFGVACFAGHFDSGVLPEMPEDIQDSRYWAAAGVSFGNLFGFLGINRLYFTELLRDHSPDGLQLVAGAQTVAGVVLLFFLGLGLRNRFRLK